MSETIRELISEEDVAAKVKEIGAQITKDYEGKAVRSEEHTSELQSH